MITHEMLCTFCSNDETRDYLCHPFNIDNYTYATNGIYLVRVDKREEYGQAKESIVRNIKAINFGESVDESLFISLPENIEHQKESSVCGDCKGTGKDVICEDCGGNKVVHCESINGYEYEDDCQMCNGTGRIQGECESCGGDGKIYSGSPYEIGSKLLDSNLLVDISKLPNLKIAPEAVQGLEPIPFRFAGGVGVIMPLRKGY